MRPAFDPNPRHIFGFASGLSAVALWAVIGADMWARAQALGPICGERGLLDHCPLCWPAAALTAISVASLLARPSGALMLRAARAPRPDGT